MNILCKDEPFFNLLLSWHTSGGSGEASSQSRLCEQSKIEMEIKVLSVVDGEMCYITKLAVVGEQKITC